MRRLLVPALAALAGIGSLVWLFPRFDPARSIGQTVDRNQAIQKARQVASQNGIDTARWQAAADTVVNEPAGPTTIELTLNPAGSKRFVEVILYPDGRLASWRPLGIAADAAPGKHAPSTPQIKVGSWDPDAPKLTIEKTDTPDAPKSTYAPVRLISGLCYLAVMIYFPVAAFRRRLHYRVPLMLMAAQVVWAAISFWGTAAYQKVLIERLSESRSALGLAMSNATPGEAWAFLWLFAFAAVGFSVRAAGNREKWATLELLGRGGFYNRAVGGSVAAGLLGGIGIAALPYLVAATGFFHGSLSFRSTQVLLAPSGNATAWNLSACVMAVALFGFVYPLAAKIRNRYFRWALFIPVGIAIAGGTPYSTPFHTSAPNLLTALLLFPAYALLYWHWDLLAAMSATVAAQAVLAPCVLLAQPGGSVRAMAVPIVIAGAALLAVSLNSAIRGREGSEAIPDEASTSEVEMDTETGRVRLAAEFDVARKAQEDALPSRAPALDGYTLAGSCTPAQQVGGDLYDYFFLADGRLGITVADVSGKGVPAALYMMVTKGLLAAATRDSSDLAYILEQINQHLYRACKKKVFVTLAAVALDPAQRRLQHGRAGHNPILWRRSSRGESVMLKPPGLGLGMAPGERFRRTLKIEELELEPGDAVVLYSDGVTEAVDSRMEQFGEDRLIRAVERTDGRPAEESRAAVLRELAEFVGATPARDDVTLVVLRVAEFAVA